MKSISYTLVCLVALFMIGCGGSSDSTENSGGTASKAVVPIKTVKHVSPRGE